MLIQNSIKPEEIEYLKEVDDEIIGIDVKLINKTISVIGWYNPR
jgi:hypothetical protein